MQRFRHLPPFSSPYSAEDIDDYEQPSLPIYDTVGKVLRYWDVLGVGKYDDFAYEDEVLWLLKNLPEAHDNDHVERLIFQAFAGQQDASQLPSDRSFLLKFLADDLSQCWNEYLHRREESTAAHARARAWMRRWGYPNRHSGSRLS